MAFSVFIPMHKIIKVTAYILLFITLFSGVDVLAQTKKKKNPL